VAKKGFSLVEVLIVVLIMGIFVGIAGSLFAGFVSNFEVSGDNSVARRRAQDVFNILQVPVQNAGIGLPAKFNPGSSSGYYFAVAGAPAVAGAVSDWNTPVSVSGDSNNILRVVYSVPSGWRSGINSKPFADFSDFSSEDDHTNADGPSGKVLALTRTPNASVALGDIVNTFVTFPGIHMHPLLVIGAGTDSVSLAGKLPFENMPDEDVLFRNVVYPNQELFLVRAGMAYVADDSFFVFADNVMEMSAVPSPAAKPPAADSWFRVEGIKAVWFEPVDNRVLTIRVLAEGDNYDSTRESTAQRAELEDRWRGRITGITFDPGIYYEEFPMTWRTRNVAQP
jgi:prepilin-type N-terminal cleavage/methylation domain-containing protein